MPNNLVDDPTTFPSPVQVPASTDPLTDTSVAIPYQQLTNRTANNKSRLDTIVPFTVPGYAFPLPAGVTVAQLPLLAADVATMQTIPSANRSDGMLCAVKNSEWYQFDIGNTASALDPIIVQPNDVSGASPGRWLLLPSGAMGVPLGIAQLDATGRLSAVKQRNGIIFETVVPIPSAPVTISATAYTDIPATTGVSIPSLLVGDILELSFIGSTTTTSGWIFSVAPATSVPGITGPVLCGPAWSSGPYPADGDYRTVVVFGSYVATAAGTYTPRIQANLNNSGILVFIDGEMRIRVVRP